jgi:hypothetical protein
MLDGFFSKLILILILILICVLDMGQGGTKNAADDSDNFEQKVDQM